MPYLNLEDGLYLIRRNSDKGGVHHYGILDVGNRIQNPMVHIENPVVIHQVPPAIRIDWLQNTGSWQDCWRITDEDYAIQRMKQAFNNPGYDLFGNNCEHFARYVATGVRESTQLQVVGVMAGLAALVWIASD